MSKFVGLYLYYMTRIFLSVTLLLTANFLFAQKDTLFTINGSLSGYPDSTDIKLLSSADNSEITSAKIIAGQFTLKGKITEPTLVLLAIQGEQQPYAMYVEPGELKLVGKKGELNQISVSGSQSHNEFLGFQQVFNPVVMELNSISTPLRITPEGPQRDSIMAGYNKVIAVLQQRIDDFVTRNPGSYVTPFVLYVTYPIYEDILLLEKRFSTVNSNIKNSQIGTSLAKYIEYYKVGAVGTLALDFTQPDTSGRPVSLSSFKGKYVLVDFWASWCAPCRMENPNVVANYQKFRNKNFTVLGVSLDRPGQKEKWIEAIKKDNLTWTHVSDLQFWANSAAQLYHVSGIPYNFLVDPQGKIVAKNLRGPDLEKKLCEIIGCN